MPTSGYTEEAFNFGIGSLPSPFKMDYSQGADGLYYFKDGDGTIKSPFDLTNGNKPAATPGTNPGAAAGAEANRLVRAAEGAVGSATSAAAQNLQNVQTQTGLAAAQRTLDLGSARAAGAALTGLAGTMGTAAANVNKTANEVGATADIFQQYAAAMERDAVFARANALPWIQMGQDITSMNANAGGMAGEWNKLYDQMSPESMSAVAATNARKAGAAAEGEALRSLGRRGVSAGSGAVAAVLAKVKEREASTVAAMMTSARQTGLAMQADALQKGFAMALQATGMGQTMLDEALKATSAATQAQSGATSALSTKGSLQSQAAQIVAAQGNMLATAGNLALGTAAAVTAGTSAALQAQNAAANTQLNAQQMAADYYSTQGGSLLSMLTQNQYNVLTALFGG